MFESNSLVEGGDLSCHYGHSKLQFRGPKRELQDRYCVVVGSSEIYGKTQDAPLPNQLEQICGAQVLNFGCQNAGIDSFFGDPSVIGICGQAQVTVLQILGAQNMSNRFYTVHPRRNDRFLTASNRLRDLYPQTDFSKYHFTGHLLQSLLAENADPFEEIMKELEASWIARMQSLIRAIASPTVLLWADETPPRDRLLPETLERGETFVSRPMIEAVQPLGAGYVEVTLEEGVSEHDVLRAASQVAPLLKPYLEGMGPRLQ